ncbi:MAG: gliding motility-associated C-terminal domain-containing protein [Pedobacter sp.]|nr:gliding motility-associated C-terminal domain-containing protein [Pedobacter sp.]
MFLGKKRGEWILPLFFMMMVLGPVYAQTTVSIKPGGWVRLQASSIGATAYQWTRDGIPLSDGKAPSYLAKIPGVYSIVTFNAGGCSSEQADPITVTMMDSPIADLSISLQSASRPITVNENFDYYLKVNNKGPDAAHSIKVSSLLPEGMMLVQLATPQLGSSTYSAATKTVSWSIPQMAPGQDAELKISVKPSIDGLFKSSASVIAATADPLMGNNVAIDQKSILTIKVPNVFTPNNDGKNDTFKIGGLESFQENQLTIFNRWGSSVYEKKGYQGDWTADGLSDGTYFYLLKVKTVHSTWLEFKGYVTVIH